MNTAVQVDAMIDGWKLEGKNKAYIVWNAALACIGWPYVFGARGQLTTKDGKQVRKFDCRGFTYWCLKQVGIELKGAGATSQWNTASNWEAKGSRIQDIPKGKLVCLFYREKNDPSKMAHTGFGLNGETCECSCGVQYFSKMKSKWTHWAIPKGLDGDVPFDPTKKPTLQRGDKGEYVRLAQQKLVEKGYDIGPSGVDGSFGKMTELAVKKLQKDYGLNETGIINNKTWEILEKDTPEPIPPAPITETKARVVADQGGTVNLRQTPSLQSKIIARVPLKTIVTVISAEEEWCKIKYLSKEGYMMTKFIDIIGDTKGKY